MDTIQAIERRHDGNEFRFVVTIANGNATLAAEVSAGELQSYASFQKATLARYGVLFRDSQYELGRGIGARNWQDEIEWQLARNGTRTANVTEGATA